MTVLSEIVTGSDLGPPITRFQVRYNCPTPLALFCFVSRFSRRMLTKVSSPFVIEAIPLLLTFNPKSRVLNKI